MGKKQPRRATNFKENVGKMLLDLGKLLFGSFILGGMLRGSIPQYMIVVVGTVGFFIVTGIGLILTTKEEKLSEEE